MNNFEIGSWKFGVAVLPGDFRFPSSTEITAAAIRSASDLLNVTPDAFASWFEVFDIARGFSVY